MRDAGQPRAGEERLQRPPGLQRYILCCTDLRFFLLLVWIADVIYIYIATPQHTRVAQILQPGFTLFFTDLNLKTLPSRHFNILTVKHVCMWCGCFRYKKASRRCQRVGLSCVPPQFQCRRARTRPRGRSCTPHRAAARLLPPPPPLAVSKAWRRQSGQQQRKLSAAVAAAAVAKGAWRRWPRCRRGRTGATAAARPAAPRTRDTSLPRVS